MKTVSSSEATQRLAIGGFTFGVEARGSVPLPPASLAFRTEAAPEIRLRIADERAPGRGTPGRQLFDARPNWRLFRRPAGCLLRTMFCDAEITTDFRDTAIHPRPGAGNAAVAQILSYPLPELLLIHLLADHGGMLLHACGVLAADGVTLFCGASGHGKSTMAGLWARENGAPILGDDRIALRRMGAEFHAFGTPWHGTGGYASPASGPVRRIFFLEHGRANRLTAMTPAAAAAALIRASFPPFWDGPRMTRTLAVAGTLAEALPARRLAFVPDARVVDLLRGKG